MAERDGSDRAVARIDHEDVVEVVRQVVRLAQVVDGLSDRPEGRYRDEVALHQPARAVLGIGEALFQRGAQRGGDRLHHPALPGLVERGDQEQRIVGLETGDRAGKAPGSETFGDVLENRVVELGHDFRRKGGRQDIDRRRAMVGVQLFEKVGRLGMVKGGDEPGGFLGAPGLERVDHRTRDLGVEPDRSADRDAVAGPGRNLVRLAHVSLRTAGTRETERARPSIGRARRNGAVEKTRTSTGLLPQRPQRCASTSSATTA